MRRGFGYLGMVVGLGVLFMGSVGCQQQAPPPTTVVEENHDTHHWDDHEAAAYRRWEAEKQREHQEYANRNAQEQKEYWDWRHSHPD